MPEITVSLCIVYAGFYLFIVFISLSVACGLYYLAELMEEYTLATKRIIGHVIKGQLLLHCLLLVDKLPMHCVLLGITSHIAYSRILKSFPYIALTSPNGILLCIATALSTGAWLHHYHATYYSGEYIAAFLLLTTWIVPGSFLLTLAGDHAVLPGGAYTTTKSASSSSLQTAPSGYGAPNRMPDRKARRGMVLRLFDLMKQRKDELLPDVLAKIPTSPQVAGLKEKL